MRFSVLCVLVFLFRLALGMTDISEKLSEIERNIQEGETMLTVLRRLPESEVCFQFFL